MSKCFGKDRFYGNFRVSNDILNFIPMQFCVTFHKTYELFFIFNFELHKVRCVVIAIFQRIANTNSIPHIFLD